jgi:sulfotransferase
MNKTYHFLSGLPRSGNTLLSAIFNQNPEIYSTPISPVSSFMWEILNSSNNLEHSIRNTENKVKTNMFLSSFLDNFYKEVEKPVIMEREKVWCTPSNIEMIKKYITPNPKIIFTVRDITDILASLMKIDGDRIIRDAENADLYLNNYLSKSDLACEYLMYPYGNMDKGLLALASAFYPENKGIFHIVEYKDLVSDPDKTMSKIYEFLEMPYYEHDFNNIKKIEKDNDEILGLPIDFHNVRESISNSSTNSDILSDYIKHKYSKMEFWRENSIMKVRGKDF